MDDIVNHHIDGPLTMLIQLGYPTKAQELAKHILSNAQQDENFERAKILRKKIKDLGIELND